MCRHDDSILDLDLGDSLMSTGKHCSKYLTSSTQRPWPADEIKTVRKEMICGKALGAVEINEQFAAFCRWKNLGPLPIQQTHHQRLGE
ncbi:Hypothetical predicted protein [Octopus vulgaris]|uniref:Uncharacterized protein n=1 Tax=Octopus vulgaris TaxID=6645 RepID=A0AA36BFT1_OCTVU|nr:Hypothetical predicted protein [Octopus vulgaris]